MPIQPLGTEITIGGHILIVQDLSFSFESEFFDRVEFSNDKLRQAKNADGSIPIYLTLFGGIPFQLITTCNGDLTPRPLTPDDSNVDSIKKRWDIKRYKISGLPSDATQVDDVYSISQSHKILLDRFQAHLAQAQMDISYTALVALQSETFSYLTSSGISMSGMALSSTESNVIIRSFNANIDKEIPGDLAYDTTTLYKRWDMVVDIMTLKNASSTD